MIHSDYFSTGISRGSVVDIDFTFTPMHAISQTNLVISVKSAETKEEFRRYKVIDYLYGRIEIENASFFAEVVGYIDPNNRGIVTYHIVNVDPTFDKVYKLDYSYSDFSESDILEFL